MKKNITIPAAYACVYLFWGITYYFIRLGVDSLPPFILFGSRFIISGSIFLLITAGSRRPGFKKIFTAMLLGSLLLGANALVTIAEQKIESYLAALILSATPLMVAVFDRIFSGIKISIIKLAGVLLGIIGVAVLFYDGKKVASPSFEILLLFGALFCWALGTSIGKKLDLPENVITSSGIQMLWVGLAGLLIAVLQGHNAALLFSASIKSLIGLGGLLVFGSTGFIAYTWLVKNEPAIRVSSSALVNPVVAVLVGLFIGRETPAVLLLPGCICILCGITFMLYGEKIIAAKK